jgi:hypothetical protein
MSQAIGSLFQQRDCSTLQALADWTTARQPGILIAPDKPASTDRRLLRP